MLLVYNRYSDRELLKNIQSIRNYAKGLIKERRAQMERNAKEVSELYDVLSILLSDENFKEGDEAIVDECITFFLAGS